MIILSSTLFELVCFPPSLSFPPSYSTSLHLSLLPSISLYFPPSHSTCLHLALLPSISLYLPPSLSTSLHLSLLPLSLYLPPSLCSSLILTLLVLFSFLGIIHAVYELYGAELAGRLLTAFGRLFTYFLQGQLLSKEFHFLFNEINRKSYHTSHPICLIVILSLI